MRYGRYGYAINQIKSVYRGVILELKGRDRIFDVLGEVEGSEPLVGQIVLEALDLIVDPITKTVILNPRSTDMPMTEILMATAYNSGHTTTLRSVQIAKATSYVCQPLGETTAMNTRRREHAN